MYLIMPDRFSNGDPSNDVVAGMRDTELDRGHMYARHGGDLEGVTDSLDYLKAIGIGILWLNPVLENDQPEASYHGYAITELIRSTRGSGGTMRMLGWFAQRTTGTWLCCRTSSSTIGAIGIG
jgi:hypothetical protein